MDAKMLLENFDVIASAPNGVKKLRELILQLAVQGKLTKEWRKENPDVEPASKLLERIKKEKKRLLAEGKMRKQKALPAIGDSDLPYELPKSWEWSQLGAVVDYQGRRKVKPADIDYDAWLLDLVDIEKGTSRLLRKTKFGEKSSKSTKTEFFAGDVLYGKLRPYLNKVIVADAHGYCTTEILPFKLFCRLSPEYLRYTLKGPAFLSYVNSKTYGVKMPRLGTDDGRKAMVSLPPLTEQKAIVTKVDQLMVLCDELEQRQSEGKDISLKLNQSALNELVEAENQEGFDKAWQRICENFDLLYDRVEHVEELKKAILQLAVMGKLTEKWRKENPDVEPARKLLERIKAEKAKLVKEGKIKKQKVLPPIKEGEKPFTLPQGWEWTRFLELGEFNRGKSKHRPRNDPSLYKDGHFPLIQTGEVARSKGTINTYHALYNDKGLAQSKIWPAGTMCITMGL